LQFGGNFEIFQHKKKFNFVSSPQILNFWLTIPTSSQNTHQLHEDPRTLVLEQKAEIERLNKKEAEDRQAITLLETRLKNNEGMGSALLKVHQCTLCYFEYVFFILILLSALQNNLPSAPPSTPSPPSSKC
jgi:hypothetical protein